MTEDTEMGGSTLLFKTDLDMISIYVCAKN